MFFVTFFVSLLLSACSFIKGNSRLVISFILIIGLSFFAGTRNEGIDNDYLEYKSLFIESITSNIDTAFLIIREPSFYLIPRFFLIFFEIKDCILATFLFFAFLGVSTKIIAIKDSKFYFLSIILYVSYIFYYQEMITIRAGVACGFFLLAIKDLISKNHKRYFLKIAIAMLFHYSSLIFILVWLLVRLKLSIKVFYCFLITSLLVAFLKINILTLLKLDLIFPKVKFYLEFLDLEESEPVNVFNYKILFSLFILILFAFKFKILEKHSQFIILFKIHILSLSFFFILSPTAMVFSLRIFDLLSIVQLLLFPMVVLVFRERVMGYLIILSYSFINIFYLFKIANTFRDYSSWLF